MAKNGMTFGSWLLVVCLWSSLYLSVAGRSWSKRDIPNGDGFVIPLEMDAKGRYVTSIGMGNNNQAGPVQKFPFVLSTSSPHVAVAGDSCTTCKASIGSSSLYNASVSTTEVNLNKGQSFQMGDGGMTGNSILEACGLLAQNGTYWWYPNQTVIVANDSAGVFGNGAAGMLGLGRSSKNASFIDTVFNFHKAWNNLTIGLALNPKGASSAGVMDLTGADESLYTGELNFNQIIAAATDVPTNYPADWSLHLDSWTVDTGAVRTEHTTGGIAIVEPYFPEIRFPVDQALLFYRDVAGAVANNDTSTGMTWQVPCNPTLALDVTFSGTPFTVPASQLVTDNGNGNCTGVVMGWDNPFVQSYMLGQAFAQTVYIVYNASRNGNDSIGFAPRSTGSEGEGSSGLSSGAVAGISVGATIAVVILLIILFLWWRHKRAVRVNGLPTKQQKGQHKIDPFTPTSSAPTPKFDLTAAGGGRPYIIEQGPIGGDVGVTTGLLSNVTPESSPNTTTMSAAHRRKAEEAGLLGAGAAAAAGANLRLANQNRPQSSQTSTTSTEFVQHLPPLPITPQSPATPEAHNQINPEAIVRHISSAGGLRQIGSISGPTPGTGVASGHLVGGTDARMSQSTAGAGMLSPTSPHQIHYHIHLTPAPGAPTAPAGFPPGSIIHEYANDEPAPEYSERPGTPEVESSAHHSAT